MSTAVEEAEVVDVGTPTVADHGVLVQVVVVWWKYKPDDDDHKRPLLVKVEDQVTDPDLTGVEQFLHLSAEAVGHAKEASHYIIPCFSGKLNFQIHPIELLYNWQIDTCDDKTSCLVTRNV